MLLVGTDDGVVALQERPHGWDTAWRALEGHSISGLAHHPKHPDQYLASTYGEGVFISQNRGKSWSQAMEQEAWSVAFSPDGIAYAGLKPAGIARSSDGGLKWTDLTRKVNRLSSYSTWDSPFPPYTAHVRTLALAPDGSGTIYGGIEVGGIIRSRDGGNSWDEMRNGVHLDIHTLAVAPTDAMIMYAATGGGFYRSFDKGASWEPAQTGMRHTYTLAVAVHPREPRTVFTATLKGPPGFWQGGYGADATIYASTDGGTTWERLRSGLPEHIEAGIYCLAVEPSRPERVFAGLSNGEIWASQDSGQTWSAIASGLEAVHCLAYVS